MTPPEPLAARPARSTTAGLAEALTSAMPDLDAPQQHIAIALYRLLAHARPVTRQHLAEHAGATVSEVARLIDGQPGVQLDERGRVVGFWGLTLGRTPHRVEVAGRELYAWCAWDTLFLPERLDSTVTVASRCPTTREEILLTLDPTGVRTVSAPTAVLSFIRPTQPFDATVVQSFCQFVHFFASEQAATDWTTRRENTFTLPIADGFEVGRAVNRLTLGAAIGHAE